MPKALAVQRTSKGLFTNYNPVHEAPEGALAEAEDVEIAKPGVISKRRGFQRWGTTRTFDAVSEFQSRLLGHIISASKISYDSDGSGTFLDHDAHQIPETGAYMRFQEADLSLYLTTSKGVFVTDQLTANPVRAGIPAGLDIQVATTGTGLGWFTPATAVAYRVAFGRIDKNGRMKIGAPSMREKVVNAARAFTWAQSGTTTITITLTAHGYATSDVFRVLSSSSTTPLPLGNYTITVTGTDTFTVTGVGTGTSSGNTGTGGKAFNLNVSFTVPVDMRDGDFFDVYRTPISAGEAVDPGDGVRLVLRSQITAAHITARDTADVGVPITFLDATEDLNLGEELYTNSTREGITQANARPPWCTDLCAFRDWVFHSNIKREHLLEMRLLDVAGLVDGTSSITFSIGATTLTYTFSAAEAIGSRQFRRFTTFSTLAENVRETMKSLVRTINRDNDQTLIYAYYVSGILDAPGQVVVEARSIETVKFYLTSNNSTTSSKFSPTIPTSGTLYASDNGALQNGLARSKKLAFDAVPEDGSNVFEIGDPSRKILRVLATQDSLIIVKEDGVWRGSGESDRNFTIKPLESTIYARAPRTWCVFQNAAWGLSTQGVVRVTESGSELVGYPVDDFWQKLITFPSFETYSFAVPYQSQSLYILGCQEFSTDTKPTIAYVYNSETESWVRWRKPFRSGHVMFMSDRLHMQHNDEGFMLRDRKTQVAADDYVDEEVNCQVTSFMTVTHLLKQVTQVQITYSAHTIREGDLFIKTPEQASYARIDVVDQNSPTTWTLTLSILFPGMTTGTGAIARGIKSRVRWLPEASENLGILKHSGFAQIYLGATRITRGKVGFSSDIVPLESLSNLLIMEGDDGREPLEVPVPTEYQLSRALDLIFEHQVGQENFEIEQVTISQRPLLDMTQALPR